MAYPARDGVPDQDTPSVHCQRTSAASGSLQLASRERTHGGNGDTPENTSEDPLARALVAPSLDKHAQLRQTIVLERLVDRDHMSPDPHALAWLRGERAVYTMSSREIVVGRDTDVSSCPMHKLAHSSETVGG